MANGCCCETLCMWLRGFQRHRSFRRQAAGCWSLVGTAVGSCCVFVQHSMPTGKELGSFNTSATWPTVRSHPQGFGIAARPAFLHKGNLHGPSSVAMRRFKMLHCKWREGSDIAVGLSVPVQGVVGLLCVLLIFLSTSVPKTFLLPARLVPRPIRFPGADDFHWCQDYAGWHSQTGVSLPLVKPAQKLRRFSESGCYLL